MPLTFSEFVTQLKVGHSFKFDQSDYLVRHKNGACLSVSLSYLTMRMKFKSLEKDARRKALVVEFSSIERLYDEYEFALKLRNQQNRIAAKPNAQLGDLKFLGDAIVANNDAENEAMDVTTISSSLGLQIRNAVLPGKFNENTTYQSFVDFQDAIDKLAGSSDEIKGIISNQLPSNTAYLEMGISGVGGGHSMGLIIAPPLTKAIKRPKYEFFDPNYGEFWFADIDQLGFFLAGLIFWKYEDMSVVSYNFTEYIGTAAQEKNFLDDAVAKARPARPALLPAGPRPAPNDPFASLYEEEKKR